MRIYTHLAGLNDLYVSYLHFTTYFIQKSNHVHLFHSLNRYRYQAVVFWNYAKRQGIRKCESHIKMAVSCSGRRDTVICTSSNSPNIRYGIHVCTGLPCNFCELSSLLYLSQILYPKSLESMKCSASYCVRLGSRENELNPWHHCPKQESLPSAYRLHNLLHTSAFLNLHRLKMTHHWWVPQHQGWTQTLYHLLWW